MLNKTVGFFKKFHFEGFLHVHLERYPGIIYPVLEGYFPPLKGYLFIFSFFVIPVEITVQMPLWFSIKSEF